MCVCVFVCVCIGGVGTVVRGFGGDGDDVCRWCNCPEMVGMNSDVTPNGMSLMFAGV